MNTLFLAVAVFIVLLSVLAMYRIVVGPTIFDRVIAAGMVGTNAFIVLVLIGFVYRRIDMFVDLAIAYALLNFIGIVTLAKYFDRKRETRG